MLEPEKSKK
jgi:hypothetical protein